MNKQTSGRDENRKMREREKEKGGREERKKEVMIHTGTIKDMFLERIFVILYCANNVLYNRRAI